MEITDPVPSQTTRVASSFRHENLATLVLRFLNRLKQTGKSTHTISAYRNDLTLFSEFLIENKVDPQIYSADLNADLLDFLHKHNRKSAASVRRAQMSVRTFLHFLIGEKIITGSPLLEVKSPRQPTHDLLCILPEHFHRLCVALKTTAVQGEEKSARDWTIVLLLGEVGLKASEAANVTWGDILLQPASDRTDASGSVRVPGPNERVLKFGEDLHNALHLLHELRTQMNLETSHQAKLFFGYMNVTRQTRTDSLHRHGIKFVVYEVCQENLGIPYNSESLRNHAIVQWLNQGLSSQQVADLAGYSSLNSLERFSLNNRGLRKPRRQLKVKSDI